MLVAQDVGRREIHPRLRLDVPEYTWAIYVPGEDLPRRLTTDYLVSEGEELDVDGTEWLVDNVEMEPDTKDALTGVVAVVPPR